jgi:hypothetical protein
LAKTILKFMSIYLSKTKLNKSEEEMLGRDFSNNNFNLDEL